MSWTWSCVCDWVGERLIDSATELVLWPTYGNNKINDNRMKQTRDWCNTVTLILYKRYTIKSKLTYLKHQVISSLRYDAASAACCAIQHSLESLPSKCRTDSRSNWDFQTVQINTCHIYSTIPSSNRDIRQEKMILKCIITLAVTANANLRLRAGCLVGYGNKIFSPFSRNDVTRSPGCYSYSGLSIRAETDVGLHEPFSHTCDSSFNCTSCNHKSYVSPRTRDRGLAFLASPLTKWWIRPNDSYNPMECCFHGGTDKYEMPQRNKANVI